MKQHPGTVVRVIGVAAAPARGPLPHCRATQPGAVSGELPWRVFLGLEHRQSGDWVPAWAAEINGCHSAPIEIAAGTVREFHEVVAVRPGESLPPGPYRLAVYGLYFSHDAPDHPANSEVPHALRLSEPFTPAGPVVP
jgi:hypothetical protein